MATAKAKPPPNLWRSRATDEKNVLDARLVELQRTLAGEPFTKLSPDQQRLLKAQEQAMLQYSQILGQRIALP